MSDFVGEQSRVHIMPISAKWKHKSSIHIGFIVFNGDVTTFFAKSVYVCISRKRHACSPLHSIPKRSVLLAMHSARLYMWYSTSFAYLTYDMIPVHEVDHIVLYKFISGKFTIKKLTD